MKKLFLFLTLWGFSFLNYAQTLINPTGNGGFESGASFPLNGWTVVNGTQTNKWFVGNPGTVGATGTRAAYISNNPAGSLYNYSLTNTSIVHFYTDVVFPAGQTNIQLSFNWKGQGEVSFDFLRVFLVPTTTTPTAGTQLAAGQLGGDFNLQGIYQTANFTLPCATAGTTQRLVFSWINDNSAGTQPPMAIDNISLTAGPTSCISLLGTGVTNVPSLPYASGPTTTCGSVDNLTLGNTVTCGSVDYLGGEDNVYIFTPTTTGTVSINLTSTGTFTGLMVYNGCPSNSSCNTSPGACVVNNQSATGNKFVCFLASAGVTYYVVVDSWPAPTCNPITNVTISAPAAPLANDECSGAFPIPVNPGATCASTLAGTTSCATASAGIGMGTCTGTPDDDVWYSFVATSTVHSVSLNAITGSTTDMYMSFYTGPCGGLGTPIDCSDPENKLLSGLTVGQTYFVRVYTNTATAGQSTNYTICVSTPCGGGSPINDLPCNATPVVLGVSSSGTNSCAFNASEPAAPACWANSSPSGINTVWYSVVVPPSGSLKIRTILLSSGTILTNTQIAVYSGTCGALTLVGCNDNMPACGDYTPLNSELNLTGLTSGATYFIAVDGVNNLVGQFELLIINGTANFPPVPGQDCPTSFPVCNSTITIGNPGYQSIGGLCDNNGTAMGECTNGEANSVWYNFSIGTAGSLVFDIVPNDFGNPNPITGQVNTSYTGIGTETDYDWVLWKVSGTGATTCAAITSSGGSLSTACNFDSQGVTGCSPSGNAPAVYAGFNAAYEISPAVVAGEQYMLAIHNFSNSSSGFTLQFPAVSPLVYLPTTTLFWSGGANTTSITTSNNWGGCGTPTCGLNAVVTGASSFQPVLTPGTYDVNDLTINIGSSLTIQNGATLNVCGNFINNGNLICEPGSTVVFVGSGTQNISGSFVGVDGFHNLTVNKLTGTVVCNNNVDIKGNFLTSNATSIFNSNFRTIKLAGNFTNNAGNTTYTSTGAAGSLEFNGTGLQTYNQGSSLLNLNFVVMNNTGLGVDLLTNMFLKNTTGRLTLNNGKIRTNGFRVVVNNSANNAVSVGNANSYVFGNLYRDLNGAIGAYDFPVGTATLYQRANIDFTSTTTIPTLQSRFDTWGAPALHTNGLSDCATTFNLPDENMGYWTINASADPNSGTYNATLYCNGATNTAGVAGWTVEKSSDAGATWVLSGTCDGTSTATIVKRNGMNGFSLFAAAQASTPLPIQLLNFNGYVIGEENYLSWETQSEHNASHYLVEKSRTGEDFVGFSTIEADGNSTSLLKYETIDPSPYFPITYYRLKQVDLDGNYEYSQTIEISSISTSKLLVNALYPNPTSGESYLNFSLPKNQLVKVNVRDVSGKIIYTKEMEGLQSNSIVLPSDEWSNGMYLVQLISAFDGNVTIKLAKE
jgi:hypothetical protein